MTSAARYLASRTRFGVKFGLDTIAAIVDALGHPERAHPTLLVAGTNGKGSVVAYLDAALRGSGLRVGRYTSPHLERVNERIVVDGREIEEPALESAVSRVREVAARLAGDGVIPAHPTYFETLTAAAFLHFRQEAVEVAVLEVGMGGRLDATNVADPLASAIVSVDFDHEQFLGGSLAAIAREKAGVLRPGRVTIIGPLAPEAAAVVRAEATAVGARLLDAFAECEVLPGTNGVDLRTPGGDYRGVQPLPGAHQHDNVLVAIRLLEAAREAGLPVDLSALPRHLRDTQWPGRLQWVEGEPPLLLDGAHNPAGARALATYLHTIGPFVLLFGVMADKNVAELARVLFPLADAVVLARPRVGRAASTDEIRARAGPVARLAQTGPSVGRALALARRLATPGRTVVVAGSLYLVGEVLALLSKRRK